MKEVLNNTLKDLKKNLENLEGWGETILYLLLGIIILVFSFHLFARLRKKILFNSWINRFDKDDEDLGKSIGDLLLFKLRYIKQTHQISSHKISLWNTFEDIPSFRQNLDREMNLLASVELGNYGKIVTGILTFLFKLVPLFIKPSSLKGSINKYGDNRTILHISLENYNPKKWNKFENLLWEKEELSLTKEQIPDTVEEMAYRIYIDLTGGDLFKSWECFKYFTKGLRNYLMYTELSRQNDLEEAEELYKQALNFEQNNPVVSYNLGVLKYYEYENDLNDQAIDLFKTAMNSTDINLRARALCGLANAYAQKYGRYKSSTSLDTLKQSIEFAKKAVFLDNKLDSAQKALAYSNHQYGEALISSDGYSMIKNPEHEGNKHRLLAEKYYKRAIRFNKNHFIAHNNLANLYFEWAAKLKKSESSKFFFRIWLLKLKVFVTKKLVIDRAYLLQKAIDHCEKALEINPSYHFAHDNLGNAYYEKGNYAKAQESFQNAILYKPTYPEANNDLAMLYLTPEWKEKDITKAKKLHKETLNLLDSKIDETRTKKLVDAFEKRMATFNISNIPNDSLV